MRSPGLYELITSPEDYALEGKATDFGRHIVWDEFKSVRYFSGDMQNFLIRLKKMIDSQI